MQRPRAARALAGAGEAAGGAESQPARRPQWTRLCRARGTVVTGQQVGLLGGPLLYPFKAATAIARARQATAGGHPHVAIFWLATEDHDFAEIDHVTVSRRREMEKLDYA